MSSLTDHRLAARPDSHLSVVYQDWREQDGRTSMAKRVNVGLDENNKVNGG